MIVDRSCGDSGYGGYGFMFIAIFLVVLFSLFRRGYGDDCGHVGTAGCVASGVGGLTAAADLMTFNRYSNYMDPELARIQREQEEQTCEVIKGQAAIQHDIDNQTCEIEKGLFAVQKNCDRNALEAERQFTAYVADQKNEKIGELRLALAEKEAKLLQQETLSVMNNQFCLLNNRITRLDDQVLKEPPFYASGGTPYVNQCIPTHLSSGCCGSGFGGFRG